LALALVALVCWLIPAAARAAVGPVLVRDIRPGPESSQPRDLTVLNGALFFLTTGASGATELWRSDGSTAGTTLVAQLPAGQSATSLATVGGRLFLEVNGELWSSDGTSAGTATTGGPGLSSSFPNASLPRKMFAGLDGVFFYISQTEPRQLWRSDGTPGGTQQVAYPGSTEDDLFELVATDDALFFTSLRAALGSQQDTARSTIYRSDGTAAGTQPVFEFTGTTPFDPSFVIYELTPVGDQLFFAVDPGSFGADKLGLWVSDGLPGGSAARLLEGRPQPNSFIDYNGQLFFTFTRIGENGQDLWRSDGTVAGTTPVKAGAGAVSTVGRRPLAVVNGLLYYIVGGGLGAVWRSDGTAAGTFQLVDGVGRAGSFAGVGNTVYLGGMGNGLWQTDGTVAGTSRILPLRLANLTVTLTAAFDGTLFFTWDDGSTGLELWKLAEGGGTGARVTDGLRALYDFDEGSGATVGDSSGAGSPLNLTVARPSQVQWREDGLQITGFTAIVSGRPATKLIDAARASDAFTAEVWVTPAARDQFSARLLTISANPVQRNFSLIQGLFTTRTTSLVSARLRTTGTARDGGPALLTQSDTLSPARTHIVYTRGADGAARIYIDGELQASGRLGGTLANWDRSYPLALGGEARGGRTWQGTYHLVAFYGRALSAEEVQQNFAAGPDVP